MRILQLMETLDYSDLKKHLQKDYLLKELPELHLDNAIEYLVGDGIIVLVNEKLSLSQPAKNQIKKEIKESEEVQNNVNEQIEDILKEKLPSIKSHQISLITNNLNLILSESFANNGTTTAKILTQSSDGMSDLKSLSGFEENYNTRILNVVSKNLHDKLDEIFHDLFSNPTEEFSKIFIFFSSKLCLPWSVKHRSAIQANGKIIMVKEKHLS